MEEFKILIPNMRPPFTHGIEIGQFQNIIKKIGEKFNVKPIWVIFHADKIQHQKNDEFEIIYYDNYDNALEILDKTKPDLILFDGDLTCQSIVFSLAGKFRKIPVVTAHFVHDTKGFSKFTWFKTRLHLTFSDEGFSNVSKTEPKKFKMLSFLLSEYRFVLRTLKKMNYSTFGILKFMSFFPRVQTFSTRQNPVHPIASGDLNLCSTQALYEDLKNSGFKSQTIFICGNPYYDNLFLKHNLISKKPNNIKPRILFCTSSYHEHGVWSKKYENDFITRVVKTILKSGMYDISLKIHPSMSSKEEYDELLHENNLGITLYHQEDFITLLSNYDIILVYGQPTILFESILLKKKVILINLPEFKEQNEIIDETIMTLCTNLNDLNTKIKISLEKTFSETDYQNLVKQFVGIFDGNCSTLAANEILKICNKKI